ALSVGRGRVMICHFVPYLSVPEVPQLGPLGHLGLRPGRPRPSTSVCTTHSPVQVPQLGPLGPTSAFGPADLGRPPRSAPPTPRFRFHSSAPSAQPRPSARPTSAVHLGLHHPLPGSDKNALTDGC